MNFRYTVNANHAQMRHYTLTNYLEPHQYVHACLSVLITIMCSVGLIVVVYIFIERTTMYIAGLINPAIVQKAKLEDLDI